MYMICCISNISKATTTTTTKEYVPEQLKVFLS